jgi:RHS repeat-associated protein
MMIRKVYSPLAIGLLIFWSGYCNGQIVLQDIVMGKADVSHPTSVKMVAGFHALQGSAFHAYIGTVQGVNSSFTVPAPSSNATPLAGSSSGNYITTITYREPKTSVPTSSFKNMEQISYFDGLGRPLQTVSVGVTPGGLDLIQPIVYDNFGRESYKFLPFTETKNGSLRTGVESTISIFYSENSNTSTAGIDEDSRPYTNIVYDNSPLNRVVSQTGPGSAWIDKPVVMNYLTNTSTDNVIGWTISSAGAYSTFTYPNNRLYVKETIDEQGNSTREFVDFQGKTIQKSSKIDGQWIRTAYIYDNFGLLRCVVPPLATDPNTQTELCYYYQYDERNRMVEKKIPGGGTVTMVYDSRDRLRCTQNSNQVAIKEWNFIKYDQLNRPIETGVINNYTAGLTAMKNAIATSFLYEDRDNSNGTQFGYSTNQSFPTNSFTIQSVTYYDDYSFISALGLNSNLNSSSYDVGVYNFSSSVDASPKGQITGTMTRILSPANDNSAITYSTLYSTKYYDKFGHLLRSISENQFNGRDVVSNIIEPITYLVTQSKQQHYKGTDVVTIEKFLEYDHTGRLLATRQKINDQPEITLSSMKYNELGQLITKYLHSSQTSGSRSFVQKVDYNYNLRGWLNKINDPALNGDNDLFGMQLYYNNPSSMGTLGSTVSGSFNGNITAMKWGIKGETMRGFVFTYDELNRMKTSNSAEGASMSTNTGYFSESVNLYDNNGNIKTLQRKYNNILVDDLSYSYATNSNRLLRITDGGTNNIQVEDYPASITQDYSYDANGNLNIDRSRNTNISYYNNLNLPAEVNFGSSNRIYYHYTATGDKSLKHVLLSNGTSSNTAYLGNVVYENDNLSYILTDEGRMVAVGTGTDRKFVYEYTLKDHLGNSRVVFTGSGLSGTVDVVQTTSYYPFGLVMTQTNNNTAPDYAKNKYLYNGKELQDDWIGGVFFGMLDYGARFYDPQIGRWHTVDPMEQFISPYVYAANNPINYHDANGMWSDDTPNTLSKSVVTPSGRIIYHDDGPDKNIYLSPDGQKGKDGNTDGLAVMGREDYRMNYSVGRYVYLNSSGIFATARNWEEANLYKNNVALEPSFVDDVIEIFFTAGGSILVKKAGKWILKKATEEVIEEIAEDAAKTGSKIIIRNSVGAAAKGSLKTIQTGGHVLNPSTLKILNMSKEEGKIAIEGLKETIGTAKNFHFDKIMGNGDVYFNGKLLGNLRDYIP